MVGFSSGDQFIHTIYRFISLSDLEKKSVRSVLSEVRGALRADLETSCGDHRCLKHGWGAICNGHAVFGLWTGSRYCYINNLKLLTVLLSMKRFWLLIQGKHVLVRFWQYTYSSVHESSGGYKLMSQLTCASSFGVCRGSNSWFSFNYIHRYANCKL